MFGLFILLGFGLMLAGVVLVFMPKRIARKRSLLIAIAGFALLLAGSAMMPEDVRQGLEADRQTAREKRTAEQQDAAERQRRQLESLNKAITTELAGAGLPPHQSIEITEGNWLVATFQIDDPALTQMSSAGITSPREFATKAVILVRNAALPFKVVTNYRVTMNGPPPGPGLIMRYGSARFSEGGSVTWEPGPPR
jgi:acyl-CoA synthetase (AMP-forming)/AMP-acid ligase II